MTMNLLTITNEVLKIKNVSIKCVRILDIVPEPTVAELEQQARSGQPISLMDLADAVHREEREKKKSVVDQLKSQPKAEHKKTAPKKSAEREI